jgi:hypothetical protein
MNSIRFVLPRRFRRIRATVVTFTVSLGLSAGIAGVLPALLLADDAPAGGSSAALPAPDGVDAGSRAPVPAAAEQAKVHKSVMQPYTTQLADRTPAGSIALSTQLVTDAGNTSDQPVKEYVLLSEARRIGIQSGDLTTSQNADIALCTAFAVDADTSQLDLLERLSGQSQAPAARAELAKAALKDSDLVLSDKKFHLAAKFTGVALQAARRAGDPNLVDRAVDADNRIRSIVTAYDRLTPTLAAIKKNPADPKANQNLGRFYCFIVGDWDTGLPQLTAGPKDDLGLAATADVAATDPLSIARKWNAQVDHVAPTEKQQVRLRAEKWFNDALPDLDGDDKMKARDELAALDRAIDDYASATNADHMADLMPSMKGKFTSYTNGIYLLDTDDKIISDQEFVPPIAFRIVAQTDSTNIRLGYADDEIIFNWEDHPGELYIGGGPVGGSRKPDAGRIPVKTWVTIDLVVLPDSMTITVDGEQRFTAKADFSEVRQKLSIFERDHAKVQVKSIQAKSVQ